MFVLAACCFICHGSNNLFLGLNFFKPVLFLVFFVFYLLSQFETKEDKDQAGLKKIKPSKKLNHNIYNGKATRINKTCSYDICTFCMSHAYHNIQCVH